MLWNVLFKDTTHNMTCKFFEQLTNTGHWDNPMENNSIETIDCALLVSVKIESINIELSILTINDCVASKIINKIWRYLWNHLYKEEEEEDYKQSDTKKTV